MGELKDSIFFRSILPKLNHGFNAVQVTTATIFFKKTCLYWNLKERKGIFCEKWKPTNTKPLGSQFPHAMRAGRWCSGPRTDTPAQSRFQQDQQIVMKIWASTWKICISICTVRNTRYWHELNPRHKHDIVSIYHETPYQGSGTSQKRYKHCKSRRPGRTLMSSLCVGIAAHINPQQLSRQAAF